MSQVLQFALPDGGERTIPVRYALNAGYARRDTEQVRHHVDALADLGDRVVPGTVLLSGTIPMIPGVEQLAPAWD